MSAVRVYRDGKPAWMPVDEGCVGRITHTRGATRDFGTLVVAESERSRRTRLQRTAMARQRALDVEPEKPVRQPALCRKWMILARVECARKARHGGSCASRSSMDAENLADRKR